MCTLNLITLCTIFVLKRIHNYSKSKDGGEILQWNIEHI